MSLETAGDFDTLTICPRCGWPVLSAAFDGHVRDCPDVAAGAVAVELAARLPVLNSTKFGYGDRYLTFEPDDNMHVRLECRNDGTFRLEDTWLLDSLSTDEAEDLVRAIADWRVRCVSRRSPVIP